MLSLADDVAITSDSDDKGKELRDALIKAVVDEGDVYLGVAGCEAHQQDLCVAQPGALRPPRHAEARFQRQQANKLAAPGREGERQGLAERRPEGQRCGAALL